MGIPNTVRDSTLPIKTDVKSDFSASVSDFFQFSPIIQLCSITFGLSPSFDSGLFSSSRL